MSDKLRFGEILVRAGVIDRGRLDLITAGLAEADDLGEQLVRRGMVNESRMLQAVGQALNLPTVVLTDLNADQRALQLLSKDICASHLVFPVELERTRAGEHLHVAMANPSDIRAIKQITRQARRRIRPLVASARDIREAIAVHYGGAAPERGPKRESPVDMFDFSVTDLSGIDDETATAAVRFDAPELPPPRPLVAAPDAAPRPVAAAPDAAARLPGRSVNVSSPPPPRPSTPNAYSSLEVMPKIDFGGVQRSQRAQAEARPAADPPGGRGMAQGSAALDEGIELGLYGDEPVDLSAISVESVDFGAFDGEPIDLSALESEPARLDAIDSEQALLSALSTPPPLSRSPEPVVSAPPPAPPRRVPPTSMPPRPSTIPPQARPSNDLGFGMIRRKRRARGDGPEAAEAVDAFDLGPPEPPPLMASPASRLEVEPPRADRVAPRAVEHGQRAPARPDGDALVTTLERALKRSGASPTQLLVLLIRQLAARDLIDADALLEELLSS